MSNTMKLALRTIILLGIMVAGSWLFPQFGINAGESGEFMLSHGILYLVYLLIGLSVGSMVGPRFSKGRNKYAYLFPLLLFFLIGLSPALYFYIPTLPFPVAGQYLTPFSDLAWALTGIFANLTFR